MSGDAKRVRVRILEMARKDERKGDWRSALRRYRRLTGLEPEEPVLHVKLGDVCVRLGRKDDAIEAFLTAGGLFAKKAFDEKAAALYKRALELAPERADVRNTLVDCYARIDRTPDALLVLDQACEHLEGQGQAVEALAVRRRMAALDPLEVEPRLRLARDLQAAGQYEEALHEYVESTVELLRQGDFERARGVFATLEALRPADAAAEAGASDPSMDRLVDRATASRTHFTALQSLYRRVAQLRHRQEGAA